MGIFLLCLWLCLWATRANGYMAIFCKYLTGITRGGVSKELEECDFDKSW